MVSVWGAELSSFLLSLSARTISHLRRVLSGRRPAEPSGTPTSSGYPVPCLQSVFDKRATAPTWSGVLALILGNSSCSLGAITSSQSQGEANNLTPSFQTSIR